MRAKRPPLVLIATAVLVAAWILGIVFLVVMVRESFPLAVLGVVPLIILATLTRALWLRPPDSAESAGARPGAPETPTSFLTRPLPRLVAILIALVVILGFVSLVRWAIDRFVE